MSAFQLILTAVEQVDEDTVTPGVVGFIATMLVAGAVVFLLVDMNRRVRRVRYREEIRQRLRAEQEEGGAAGGESPDGNDRGGSPRTPGA